jgi:hypothetical protein
LFYRFNGNNANRAMAILSLFQALLLGVIVLGCVRTLYPVSEISKYAKFWGKVGGGFGLVLFAFNIFHYRNKYPLLEKRWGNKETLAQSRIRGFLVVLAILFPFIFMLGLANVFPLPDIFWPKK